MSDLISTLEQLTGASNDLGGGPGPDDTRALAQLILGGGKASVGGQSLFGGPAVDPMEEAVKQLEMGGFGRKPDAALAQAVREGRVDPSTILGRPVSPKTKPQLTNAAPGVETVARVPAGEDPIEVKAAGTFTNMRNAAPINPGFQRVVDTANQIADTLKPGRDSVPVTTLLPNPYGPGSFDPQDPTAVEKVKAQGEQAQKIRQVKDLLSGDFLSKLPPGTPTGAIVKQLLESVGVVKSDAQRIKEEAQAKAEGERAGGKGVKSALPTSLTAAVGKPGFQQELQAAVESGQLSDPNQQLRLQAQHDTAVKAQRVEGTDRRLITGLRSSQEAVDELRQSFESTPAFKSGKFSDTLKASLATNKAAASILEFNPISTDGLTKEEVDFATKYNSVLGRLRDFSGDSRFSDNDATRVMKALGNPITGAKVFTQQLNQISKDLERRRINSLDDIEASGRDVSKLRETGKAKAQADGQRAVSKSGKPIVFRNGRWEYE